MRPIGPIALAMTKALNHEPTLRSAQAKKRRRPTRATVPPTSSPRATNGPAHMSPSSGFRSTPGGWMNCASEISEFEMQFNAIHEKLRAFVRAGQASSVKAIRPVVVDLDRAETTLQDITTGSWALRLVPIGPTLDELANHAHGLSVELGKQIRVTVEGSDAQVERRVLDALWDPLVHLVRNAIDHGIELPSERVGKPAEASLLLHAETIGPAVVVSVIDDGKGIDPKKVREAALLRKLMSPEALDGSARASY